MDLDFWKGIRIICVAGTLGLTVMVLSVWHKISNKEFEVKKPDRKRDA
jgi:hypothetical protein